MSRRPIALVLSFVLSFALALSLGAVSLVAQAATIAPTTTCANGVDNPGGKGLICEVTIVNTITASGGSAVVTLRECHGAAGDPTAACTVKTTSLTKPVTAVTQCNSSANGGGATLRCSVKVTNNFIGLSPTVTTATVNQCVGSATGDGTSKNCQPDPATTTGATITECNGSANGGGASLTCTATGTQPSDHGIKINQCNGSANGGGALAVCSASIANNVAATTPTPTTKPTPGPTARPTPTSTIKPTPGPTARPTSGPTGTPGPTASLSPTTTDESSGPDEGANVGLVLLGLIFLVAAGLLSARSRSRTNTQDH